jgi:hypothetical protein
MVAMDTSEAFDVQSSKLGKAAPAPRAGRRVRAGFPFAAMVLLVTALASLLACADLQRWHEQYAWLEVNWPWRLVALFGGAGVAGGLIGCGYLFVSSASWRTRLVAPIAGVLASQLAVLILVAPGPMWRIVFAVAVLLATTVLFRLGAE